MVLGTLDSRMQKNDRTFRLYTQLAESQIRDVQSSSLFEERAEQENCEDHQTTDSGRHAEEGGRRIE